MPYHTPCFLFGSTRKGIIVALFENCFRIHKIFESREAGLIFLYPVSLKNTFDLEDKQVKTGFFVN